MRAYSVDLRERVLRAVDAGTPLSVVARTFAVSPATIRRYRQQRRVEGTLQPRPRGHRLRHLPVADEAALCAQVGAMPDATLAEHCAEWARTHGVWLSVATMHRSLRRAGCTRKKNGSRRPSKMR